MEKLAKILDKFLKNKNNTILYIILIIGIGILIVSGTFFSDKSEKQKTSQTAANSLQTSVLSNDLETHLGNILSEIKGAGKVSVMITYESSGQKILAYDSKETQETSDESDADRSKSDNKHTAEKNIIISSDSLPVVVEEHYAKVKGVIVVSEGANDPYIKQALTEAVYAACNVPMHKIKVFVKK